MAAIQNQGLRFHPGTLSRKKTAFQKRVLEWCLFQGRSFPWRQISGAGKIAVRDPYAVFVSEVMLQQTQVERVIPYYRRWMRRWPTAQRLARSKRSDVIRAWGGLGYNRRAVHLHEAAKKISSDYGGIIPRDEEALMQFPGVGRYTARAIRAFAFGEDVGVLETNTRRVLKRIFFGVNSLNEIHSLFSPEEIVHSLRAQRMDEERAPRERSVRISSRSGYATKLRRRKGSSDSGRFSDVFARLILTGCVQRGNKQLVSVSPFKKSGASEPLPQKALLPDSFTEDDLLALADMMVPKGKGDEWNQAMMDFGAMVCTAKKPKCEECPLQKMCVWYRLFQVQSSKFKAPAFAKASAGRQNYNSKRKSFRKARQRFEETDRYFRGRIVDLIRKGAVSEQKLSTVMTKRYQLSDAKRLRKLLFGLVADGLIVVLENRISLP